MDGKYLLIYFLYLLVIRVDSKEVITIDDDNWDEILDGEWMLEFYAPWCPACKSLQSTWKKFAEESEDLGINVGQTDVTSNPGLSGRFLVAAFPTIYHIKDGSFRKYNGTRNKDTFIRFITEKKWQYLDPLPWWRSPVSIHMSLISHVFKLALTLREYQNHLIRSYGIPRWGSYVLFAVGIIFCVTVLGLLFVCVLDVFSHPKVPLPKYILPDEKDVKPKESEDKEEKSEEEDVLEDEPNTTEQQSVRKRKTEKTE